jgi:hypothetical protein
MIVLVTSISITVVCVVLLIGETRRHSAARTKKQRESPPSHTSKRPRVDLWSLVWMISLTVLCLSIIFCGWVYPRALFLPMVPIPAFITPAYLQGYNLSCGVLIWLVFRTTIGRNQGGVKSVISLLAISGSVLATVLISNRAANIAMEEIQGHVSSLASSGSRTPISRGREASSARLNASSRRSFPRWHPWPKTMNATALRSVGRQFWIPKRSGTSRT